MNKGLITYHQGHPKGFAEHTITADYVETDEDGEYTYVRGWKSQEGRARGEVTEEIRVRTSLVVSVLLTTGAPASPSTVDKVNAL